MATVRQVLASKGSQVWSVGPRDTVLKAIQLMADKNVGSLLVLEDDDIVGIITERGYARDVFLKGKSSPSTLVGDIMGTPVQCISPTESVEACMALMTERRVRHLPVIEGGNVVGIVSIGDLVKCIIDEQGFVISQLENYIRG